MKRKSPDLTALLPVIIAAAPARRLRRATDAPDLRSIWFKNV